MGWSRSVEPVVLALALAGCRDQPATGYTVPPPDGIEIVCPVTKERCIKGPETEAAIYRMRSFYFCRPESRAVFDENPERYTVK